MNADGTKEFIFKDAYQQFEDTADEIAIWTTVTLCLLGALIPTIMVWYKRRKAKADEAEAKKQLKLKTELLQEYYEEQEKEREEEKQRQYLEQTELRKRREEEMHIAAVGDLDSGAPRSADDEEDDDQSTRDASSGGGSFKCAVCAHKKYKSIKQLEQHYLSKDHLKLEKQASRAAATAAAP